MGKLFKQQKKIISGEELRNKKKRLRFRPWVIYGFCFIFGVVFIINFVKVFEWGKDNNSINNLEKELDKIVEITEVADDGDVVNPPDNIESDYWYYIKVPFYDVNFTTLLEKNSDTVGFINVRGTNINYPIVQADDNDYYLTHAFDKSKNSAGWVYLDYRNNKEFSDDNTIIYGHGRLNKTVFGSLKDLLTQTWQNNKDNYIISISTPTVNYVYQIFSIYTIESELYYITPKFSNTSSKKKWIDTMKQRNISIIDTDVNYQDKIITLSTCLNDNGWRIVVHGKLIKQQYKETAS